MQGLLVWALIAYAEFNLKYAKEQIEQADYFLSKHKTEREEEKKITGASPTIHNKVNQACLETTEASVDV